MDGLIELVAASFARHGIECPAGDSKLVWGRAPSRAFPERSRRVQAEQSSAAACGHSLVVPAVAQAIHPAAPAFTTALPDHNYRKSLQGDPAP